MSPGHPDTQARIQGVIFDSSLFFSAEPSNASVHLHSLTSSHESLPYIALQSKTHGFPYLSDSTSRWVLSFHPAATTIQAVYLPAFRQYLQNTELKTMITLKTTQQFLFVYRIKPKYLHMRYKILELCCHPHVHLQTRSLWNLMLQPTTRISWNTLSYFQLARFCPYVPAAQNC